MKHVKSFGEFLNEGKVSSRTHSVYQMNIEDTKGVIYPSVRITVKKGEGEEERAKELAVEYIKSKGSEFKEIKAFSKAMRPDRNVMIDESVLNERMKLIKAKDYDKLSDDEKLDKLLTVFSDPDEAEEHLDKKFVDLPPEAQSNIYEGIIRKTETITVEHEIDFYVDSYFAMDMGMDDEEHAEMIAKDVSLKSGSITFERRSFEIQGETLRGNNLYVAQDGEFDMYGGPYEPKMKTPTVTVNGKNILGLVKKAFQQYGWGGGSIDLSRTDIWGHVVK